jgi:hypothetical protein
MHPASPKHKNIVIAVPRNIRNGRWKEKMLQDRECMLCKQVGQYFWGVWLNITNFIQSHRECPSLGTPYAHLGTA